MRTARCVRRNPRCRAAHRTLSQPPPAACATIPATLADLTIALPLHPALTRKDTEGARYAFLSPKGLRSACRATGNGTRSLALHEITIRTGRHTTCQDPGALPFLTSNCAEKPWTPASLTLSDSVFVDRSGHAMDRASPRDTWRKGTARCAPGGPTLDCSAEAVLPSNIHAFWTFRATPGQEAKAFAASEASVIATMRAIFKPD